MARQEAHRLRVLLAIDGSRSADRARDLVATLALPQDRDILLLAAGVTVADLAEGIDLVIADATVRVVDQGSGSTTPTPARYGT